ncbi:MAG: tetratricopeptide repeat protein [Odoribacteraceae bacterium]|nr:tetratricopeptide repeat protein [Odoribacteraceae bacterium]
MLLTAAGPVAGQEAEEGIVLDARTVELYNEALQCTGDGDYRGAVTRLVEALERTPGERRIYMSLVEPCFNTGQIALLREHLKRAKTFFPADDEICYYLATVYLKENNLTMAIREFTRAIDSQEKEGAKSAMLSTYYTSRGNCYLKINRFDQAIADYDNSLALDAAVGSIYANRGIAYFKTGRPFLACQDWRKAKSLGISSVNQYIVKYCKNVR